MTKQNDLYSSSNQFDLQGIFLYANETSRVEDYIDLSSLMVQLDIFEDIFADSISAQLTILDPLNIVDMFPILGGERIKIKFKTPSFDDVREQEFAIYKIGPKAFTQDDAKVQVYSFYLCTVDYYNNINTQLSMAFKTTWENIVGGCLQKLKTKKDYEFDTSVGIQNYIAPFWNPLQVCKWAAKRAFNDSKSPFLFYETLQSYNFKAVKTLYNQEPFTKLYIEPRKITESINNPDKALNTIISWEYKESLDKIKNIRTGALGTNYYMLDMKTLNLSTGYYDYNSSFDSLPHVEKNQLIDNDINIRNLTQLILTNQDGSHTTFFERNTTRVLMDTFSIMVKIPGNSEMTAGSIVELDIPAKSGESGPGMKENMTSGRWFVPSVRHVIQKDSYVCILELVKDSLKFAVDPIIK